MQENVYFVFLKRLNRLLDYGRDLHSLGHAPKQTGGWLQKFTGVNIMNSNVGWHKEHQKLG